MKVFQLELTKINFIRSELQQMGESLCSQSLIPQSSRIRNPQILRYQQECQAYVFKRARSTYFMLFRPDCLSQLFHSTGTTGKQPQIADRQTGVTVSNRLNLSNIRCPDSTQGYSLLTLIYLRQSSVCFCLFHIFKIFIYSAVLSLSCGTQDLRFGTWTLWVGQSCSVVAVSGLSCWEACAISVSHVAEW